MTSRDASMKNLNLKNLLALTSCDMLLLHRLLTGRSCQSMLEECSRDTSVIRHLKVYREGWKAPMNAKFLLQFMFNFIVACDLYYLGFLCLSIILVILV